MQQLISILIRLKRHCLHLNHLCLSHSHFTYNDFQFSPKSLPLNCHLRRIIREICRIIGVKVLKEVFILYFGRAVLLGAIYFCLWLFAFNGGGPFDKPFFHQNIEPLMAIIAIGSTLWALLTGQLPRS